MMTIKPNGALSFWSMSRNLSSRDVRLTQLFAKYFYIILLLAHNVSRFSVDAHTISIADASVARTSQLKYILYWTASDWWPFSYLGSGQEIFRKLNCPHTNCYLTDDKSMFNGDVTKFNAILFNGRNMDFNRPKQRNPAQVYIYVNTESAKYFPIPSGSFNNFFNWTMTYRLDSDIKWPYFTVKRNGTVIGPKVNMDWLEMEQNTKPSLSEDIKSKIANKRLAAAWFVSNCDAMNRRLEYAKELQGALKKHHGLSLDIYGACGTKTCPRSQEAECDRKVSRDYYFYLSFENSFSVDYVTEKVLKGIDNFAVPIVYGGADYSRFLPPDSYLDATKHTPVELANTMAAIIESRQIYESKFLWKSYYTYHSTPSGPCNLCSALNNNSMIDGVKTYNDISKWWNR